MLLHLSQEIGSRYRSPCRLQHSVAPEAEPVRWHCILNMQKYRGTRRKVLIKLAWPQFTWSRSNVVLFGIAVPWTMSKRSISVTESSYVIERRDRAGFSKITSDGQRAPAFAHLFADPRDRRDEPPSTARLVFNGNREWDGARGWLILARTKTGLNLRATEIAVSIIRER